MQECVVSKGAKIDCQFKSLYQNVLMGSRPTNSALYKSVDGDYYCPLHMPIDNNKNPTQDANKTTLNISSTRLILILQLIFVIFQQISIMQYY